MNLHYITEKTENTENKNFLDVKRTEEFKMYIIK